MRYCRGRGRSRCQRIGDVFHRTAPNNSVTDAIGLIDDWLRWYEQREWFRRLIV